MKARPDLRRTLLVLLALAALAGAVAGATVAAFTAVTQNPASSFGAKPVFPALRSTTAWNLRDASGASEADASNVFSFADGQIRTTKAWASAFATNRYLELDFAAPLPAGLSASSVAFNFRMSADASANTSCYYFEVRRASTGAVLATHGSDVAPVACISGTAQSTTSTAISSVTTTDVANDLRIRVYARDSASQPIRVDMATVDGSTPYSSFTLHPKLDVDAADTAPATTTWGVWGSGDGVQYQSAAGWPTAFSAAKYLKLSFPAYVPNAATITSVSLDHGYRSTSGADDTCWYLEVYSRDTLLATHGSATTPVSCNNGAVFVTDTVVLSSVDTVGKANNLSIKLFVRNSAGGSSQHDVVRLKIDYYVDPGACSSFGSQTVAADQDAYVAEDSPAANFGTGASLFVKSDGAADNRTFVRFPLPAVPGGCSLREATVRLYAKTAASSRTLEALRAASSWTETGVTWTSQPPAAGTAATAPSATGWRDWNVTSHVQAMYAGANDGFVLRDGVESAGTAAAQDFASREDTVGDPELYVAWG